ncbi:c-type cytochrome [Gallaecimonas mangrovi]|uniref:c-type cytochrome n=1 Tax=Gallaecimonas mangrovi TaxID=2291597 RepID=UPI000E1FDDA9|nr:cytochrome c [Gallaecimonas mangrovi]
MKKTLTLVGVLIVAALVIYIAAIQYDLHKSYPESQQNLTGDALKAQVARGKYLATASDCVACHTAPKGGKPFAGGYPIDTPFGTILSSNITSDKSTGIGSWTQEQFDRAVRHGKGSHGYLYPAMPYNAYARLTDQDLADIWAYMKTVPAVQNKVVENQLPFPYNQRWLLGGWNLLFFHASTFTPQAGKSAAYNRGAYLVEGPGHCAACHTAKNALGGDSSATLQGGNLSGWHAPDLTPNPHTGLGNWTTADIAQYLKTGAGHNSVATGPMAEAVHNSTQFLTDSDLNAIATYLKAQPASDHQAPAALTASNAQMQLGKRVYNSQCSACHISSGEGVNRMIPGFVKNAQVNANSPASLVHMVLTGADGVKTASNPTGAGMPRFDWKLSDQQIAGVLTYIRNRWGNAAPAVTSDEVAKARKALKADSWLGAKMKQ